MILTTRLNEMFDTTCTFPLTSELFAQAIHPSESLVAVGLSSGHVSTLRLPPAEDGPAQKKRRGSNGTDIVDTAWRTRRHKGSCRCLCFSVDGSSLFSAGTDGIVKAADTATGKVMGKVSIPRDSTSSSPDNTDGPTVIHALSPQTLLLGTDSGALHLYDLRDPAPTVPSSSKAAFTTSRPAQSHHPHPADIASLTPLPPSSTSTSGYSKQFLTTGGTTLALTDLRRGVLVKSEDQEELLLSSLYVTGLPAKKSSGSSGEKALIGGGDGVITLWEKGQWDDQDERIVVSKDQETLDALAFVPNDVGSGFGKRVAVGLGDGNVRFVQLGQNRVVGEVRHDEVEGVIGLGFDVAGRMISGGGQLVKVWEEKFARDADEDEPDGVSVAKGRDSDEDSEDSEDSEADQDSSDEEEKPAKRKKKRKRGSGKAAAGAKTFSFAGLD